MENNYGDLFGAYSINDSDGDYSFSANIDFKTGKFYMPSLEFRNIKDPEYPASNLVWDNSEFLYENFYPFLVSYLEDEPEDSEKDIYEPIYGMLDNEECEILINILDKGRELGWDKL